eukprot:Gb_31481 [translate_table: standard]
MRLDQSPSYSYSWLWDSHKTPRHSGWLQSTLGELDEKIKNMLKLVDEDADSFAKRAEMYYKKRPELVSLIEEFYRAYRSLAERYDHLNCEIEIGHNIFPKSIHSPCELYGESPAGSPLGKQNSYKKENPGFEKLLVRFGSCNSVNLTSETSVVEDVDAIVNFRESDRKENDEYSDQDPYDRSTLTSVSQVDNPSQDIAVVQLELRELCEEKRRIKDRCKFVLAENKNLWSRIKQVQMTITKLEEGKQKLLERLSAKSFQCRELENQIIQLKKDMDSLNEENMTLSQQNNRLVKELHTFEAENMKLMEQNIDFSKQVNAATEQNKVFSTVLGFLRGQVSSLVKSNIRLRNEITDGNQQMGEYFQMLIAKETQISPLQDEKRVLFSRLEDECTAEEQRVSLLNIRIEQLQGEVVRLGEENREQHIALLDRNEEKREAIRQLCFTIDILRDKNQRLEQNIRYLRRRLDDLCPATNCTQYSSLKYLYAAFLGQRSRQ